MKINFPVMVTGKFLSVCIVVLACVLEQGHCQTFNCFADSAFSCSGGPGGQRSVGQKCCDDGFLAFTLAGSEDCTVCPGNSICHVSSDCSDVFPGLGTQTPHSCCGTGGGSAYVGSSGICQECPSIEDSCFTGSDCTGATVPLTSTRVDAQIRECCLSENGQSYAAFDQCNVCVVYGFLQTRIVERERGQGYPFEVGYVKGTGRVFRGRIEEVPGGSATETDYSISPTIFTGRPGNPAEIIATFRVDNIAQEINETAQLKITVTLGTFPPEAIFIDTIEFVIVDSDEVRFHLTENDYRSDEDVKMIPVVVSKNIRLANPVTFLLTPFNESEAIRTGQPLPANLPLDDNPLSPNRAKSYSPDREDFSSDVITVTFPADETGTQINDMPAPIVIFEDEINEALEEVFIVVLTLQSSTDPGSVIITRVSSLCRIIDNDNIVIGFQNASYTFPEPQFVTEIFGVVFLEKENGRISEQEFRVVVEVSTATPNANIRPATLTSRDANGTIINNDYLLLDPDQTVLISTFLPSAQTLEFVFTLFPNEIAEGTKAFQATCRSSPSEGTDDHDYTIPTELNTLFAETFIIIEDDDPVILGFEQNFTVPEDVGSFEACFRIFNPPDDQELTFLIDLVVDTIEGTAGNLDFTPIRSSNFDVIESLNQNNRKACFEVTIYNDQAFENTETFSLLLSLDVLVLDTVRKIVTIEPSVVYVTIEDTTAIDCGPLSNPANGLVNTSSGTTSNRSATYSCYTGYVLTGGSRRVCRADGRWNSTAPTCIVVDCGPLPNLQNRRVDTSTGTVLSSLAMYSCDVGHFLIGVSWSVCGPDGIWTPGAPSCPVVECGPLPHPENGLVDTSSGTTYNNRATYTCGRGYILNGNVSRTCQSSGSWSNTANPVCKPVDCGVLPDPENGYVDTSAETTLGQCATYRCNTGYRLRGSMVRTCNLNGHWTPSTPSCDPVNCGSLSNPVNGRVYTSLGTTFQKKATYSCEVGYILSGTVTRTCREDEQWTPDSPTCPIVDCGPLPNLEKGHVDTSSGTTYNSVATYNCIKGYVLLNNNSERHCGFDGSWSSAAPSCVPIDCGSLPDPENGRVEMPSGTTYNSIAKYSCFAGYLLIGEGMRLCQFNSSWIPTSPYCVGSTMLQLKFGPTDHCIKWNERKAAMMDRIMRGAIQKALLSKGNYSISLDKIRRGIFSCRSSVTKTTFRTTIMGTNSFSAVDLAGGVQKWVESGPAVTVQWYLVDVDKSCPVVISSMGEQECD